MVRVSTTVLSRMYMLVSKLVLGMLLFMASSSLWRIVYCIGKDVGRQLEVLVHADVRSGEPALTFDELAHRRYFFVANIHVQMLAPNINVVKPI
jgi:hypothetical protein